MSKTKKLSEDVFVRVYECGCIPAGTGTEADPLRIDWCFTHLPAQRTHAVRHLSAVPVRGSRP